MFGHVRGAFTGADTDRVGKFAAVGGGTLVLDEIDSLPLALQAKLLRAVEERVFEPVGSNKTQPMQARIIATATSRWTRRSPRARFRADLYYRLNVVAFRLPPAARAVGRRPAPGPQVPVRAPGGQARGVDRDRPGGPADPGGVRLAGQRPRAAQRDRAGGRPVRRADRHPDRPARGPPRARAGPGRPRPGGPRRPAAPTAVSSVSPRPRRPAARRTRCGGSARPCGSTGTTGCGRPPSSAMSRVSLYKKLHKYGLFEKAGAGD